MPCAAGSDSGTIEPYAGHRLRLLHPDKRVRWKVIAMAPDGGFAPDHAPDDHGWYG